MGLAFRVDDAGKLTLPCDIHKGHQVYKAAFNLGSRDLSGLLATCMSPHGAGALHT